MLLYNNPGRTGYGMSQTLVERLAHPVENLVGMKDSSGDMTQIAEFIRRNADVDFRVMCGKDTLIFGGLVHGAVGAVCPPPISSPIWSARSTINSWRATCAAPKDYANLLGLSVGEPVRPSKPSPAGQLRRLREKLELGGFGTPGT